MVQKKKNHTTGKHRSNKSSTDGIYFIVPMPGKKNWREPKRKVSLKQLQQFSQRSGDLALEDFQAQLLMQREYLID